MDSHHILTPYRYRESLRSGDRPPEYSDRYRSGV